MKVKLGPPLALWVLMLAVYGNTFYNGFHLDDFYRVKDNPGIHQVSAPWRHFVDPNTMATLERITQYRPMLPLTLSVNYALAGDSLPGYHFANLLFQWLAAWLLFLLGVELLLHWVKPALLVNHARTISLAVAAVFAVHPVSGILVNYICARDQTLMQVFLHLALWVYLRLRRGALRPHGWAWVLLALLGGLFSKTDALVLPGLVLLFEFTLAGEPLLQPKAWLRVVPFVAVVLTFMAWVRLGLRFSDLAHVLDKTQGSLITYPLTQARLHVFHYLWNFVWPWGVRQDPFAPAAHSVWEWEVTVSLGVILTTLVLGVMGRHRAPLSSFCVLAYWVCVFPTSSVFPFWQVAVDYRPYPASPFLFLALGVGVFQLLSRRAALACAVGLVGYFSAASVWLNTTWKTEEILWRHSVEHGGGALAHLNYAMATSNMVTRKENLEEALRQGPNYILAHMNLGRTLLFLGQKEAGMEHVLTAVRLDPNNAQTRYWASITYGELKDLTAALGESEAAARLDPHNHLYAYKAAQDAHALGQDRLALHYVYAAKNIEPTFEPAAALEAQLLASTLTPPLDP